MKIFLKIKKLQKKKKWKFFLKSQNLTKIAQPPHDTHHTQHTLFSAHNEDSYCTVQKHTNTNQNSGVLLFYIVYVPQYETAYDMYENDLLMHSYVSKLLYFNFLMLLRYMRSERTRGAIWKKKRNLFIMDFGPRTRALIKLYINY